MILPRSLCCGIVCAIIFISLSEILVLYFEPIPFKIKFKRRIDSGHRNKTPRVRTHVYLIRTQTFDLVKHKHRIWGPTAMTDYIIGKNQTEHFKQKSNNSFISEVQPRSLQYIINNETLCKSTKIVDFVLIVYSAPKHFKDRNTVRQSWGQIDIFPK